MRLLLYSGDPVHGFKSYGTSPLVASSKVGNWGAGCLCLGYVSVFPCVVAYTTRGITDMVSKWIKLPAGMGYLW